MKLKRILSALLAALMLAGICMTGVVVSADDSLPFSDVKNDWSYDAIKYVTENGLMNGTGGDKFSPNVTLTRAMVATVIYRMEGSPRVTFSDIFVDISDREFYSDAAVWTYENGIVNGTKTTEWGDPYFSPNNEITRQEMATMFIRYAEYRYIKTQTDNTLDKYSDKDKVASWAANAMLWATSCGLIKGTGGSELSPAAKATRAEFATIIHRFSTINFDYNHNLSEPKPISKFTQPDYPRVDDANIYVAVNGDDKNGDGSFAKPYATFEKARDAVREIKNAMIEKGEKGEIKVAFKAGNYGNLNNLVLSSEDAGSADIPITYCAYGDGDVVFSNGILIPEKDFVPIDDADKELFISEAHDYIYKVDLKGKIDKFGFNTRLFTETGVGIEARHPNTGSYYDITTTVDDHASIMLQEYLPDIVESFKSTEGMKVTGFLRTGWLVDCFPVLSYDKETNILTFDFENAPFDNGYSLDTYPLMEEERIEDTVYFSNLPEFLDNNNEFWFDNKNSVLYVYRARGEYSIDNGEKFITINRGADYINIVGLEFNTTSTSAIEVEANHITFDMCTICNVGGRAAIEAPWEVSDITVKNCEIYNCVDSCVYVDSAMSGSQKNLISGNNVIENNYFHDFTLPQYFSSAVEIQGDVGTRVAHNIFEEGGHGAVRYNDCIDLVIEYNVFDRIMTKTADFGAVYTWNSVTYRSNEIRYNIFKNIPIYAIYLDDNTCGQKVYCNVFYNNGENIVQNGGRENEIRDNIFIGKGSVTSNPGRYSYITDGNPEKFTSGDAFYDRFMNSKPKEGDPMYETWLKRWPELYDYNIDPTKVGDPKCLFTTHTYLSNNSAFGTVVHNSEMINKFGIDTNNKVFSMDENPYFVNPSIGNYSIKDGADFADNHFDKIGRY